MIFETLNTQSTALRIITRFTDKVRMLGIFLVVFSLTSCGWLNKDDFELPEEEIPDEVTAPVASFTQSVEAGKSPLTITFTSTSTPGSSPITRWDWDFGDGQTSNLENPEVVYTEPGTYSVSLYVESADGNNSLTKSDIVTVAAADILLTFSVVDEKGLLLDDYTVTSDDFQIENQEMTDTGMQIALRPSETEGIFQIIKSGYLTKIQYEIGALVDKSVPITLIQKNPPILFDPALGKELVGEDGTSVTLPDMALVNSQNEIVTGTVEAYITTIDTGDIIELNAFPGSFWGGQEGVEDLDQLFSYGVVDITFEQNGEILQLADGATADLKLPLFATQRIDDQPLVEGDTMPVWYLDEDTGIWMYESLGTVVADALAPNGLALQGTTSHFTSFNADINPPGLGSGGGGGSGVGNGNNFQNRTCVVNIDLLGAEPGEQYLYILRYFFGSMPSSSRPRIWDYDGSTLTHPILRGMPINATVIGLQSGLQGDTNFMCTNQDEVSALINLGDAPAEIKHMDFQIEPVFTRNANNLYEITSNIVYIGAYFLGADTALFTAEIFEEPYILGSSIYVEFDYTPELATPADITAHVSNEFGGDEQTQTINYLHESPPILGYTYGYFSETTFETIIGWDNLEGADSVRVYFLGEDINAEGQFIGEVQTINLLEPQVQMAGENYGLFRVEYSNQYGTVVEYIRIGEESCPPFSDLCVVPV